MRGWLHDNQHFGFWKILNISRPSRLLVSAMIYRHEYSWYENQNLLPRGWNPNFRWAEKKWNTFILIVKIRLWFEKSNFKRSRWQITVEKTIYAFIICYSRSIVIQPNCITPFILRKMYDSWRMTHCGMTHGLACEWYCLNGYFSYHFWNPVYFCYHLRFLPV